jgi:nucleoside-diphosphate-sugar epimerase
VIRILITGPTGFLGSHCLKLLIASDYDELHAVNRSGRPNFVIPGGMAAVRWHAADLSDAAASAALIETIKPTHILHGAWIATPGVYAHSTQNWAWLTASIALIQSFAVNGGRRFVGIGTSAEYDASDAPCREDATCLRPTSIYGETKLKCGTALFTAAESAGFSAAWGRVFLPYGPGDSPQRLIPSVLSALRARQPIALSPCDQVRDFIFAHDVADLLVNLLWSDEAGVFNVGTGTGSSVRSVLELLSEPFNGSEYLQFGKLPMRPGEPMTLVANTEKLRNRLGWQPRISLKEGLEFVRQVAAS